MDEKGGILKFSFFELCNFSALNRLRNIIVNQFNFEGQSGIRRAFEILRKSMSRWAFNPTRLAHGAKTGVECSPIPRFSDPQFPFGKVLIWRIP
jgi:hypothetical protein